MIYHKNMKLALAQLNPIIGDINANKELIVRSYKELNTDADLIIFSSVQYQGILPWIYLLMIIF